MSIQCSIFGHSYAEPATERERMQDDSEVVVTEREVKTCTRCGDEVVVSENKEVRTVEAAGDVTEPLDVTGEDPGGATEPVPGTDESTTDPPPETDEPADRTGREAGAISGVTDRATHDGEGEGGGVGDESDTDAPADKQIPDAETGEEMGPERRTDDAIILDDDTDEREPGEWPSDWPDDNATDDTGEESLEWPGEEKSRDVASDQTETEVLKDGTTTGAADTSDRETREPEDTAPENTAPDDPDIEPTRDALTVPEGEFYCSDCGFTSSVEGSALREGDFCPHCHEGSIEHRAE